MLNPTDASDDALLSDTFYDMQRLSEESCDGLKPITQLKGERKSVLSVRQMTPGSCCRSTMERSHSKGVKIDASHPLDYQLETFQEQIEQMKYSLLELQYT